MADEQKPRPKVVSPAGDQREPLRVRQLPTKPPKPAKAPKPPNRPRARSSFPGWIVSGRFGRAQDRHEPTVAPIRAAKLPAAPANVDAFEWSRKEAPPEAVPPADGPADDASRGPADGGGALSVRVLIIGAVIVAAIAVIVRALR